MLAFVIAAAAAAPLEPIGKWNLDYQPSSCVLARQYGDPANPVVVGWQAIPLTRTVDILISEKSADPAFRRGDVAIDVGGRSDTGRYMSFPTMKSNRRMTTITTGRALFANGQDSEVATFRLNKDRTFSFRLDKAANSFAMFEKCIDRTLVDWGVDPAVVARAVTDATPIGSEAQWLTADDYPAGAWREGRQGISVLLWKVGIDGRVSDCRAVVPSGSELLDEAGCKALTGRARYVAARDETGAPIVSYKTRKIIWSVSGGLAAD